MVAPAKGPFGRDAQFTQLAGRNLSGDLCFDELADAGFADAAGACDKEENSQRRLMKGLVGGNQEIRRR